MSFFSKRSILSLVGYLPILGIILFVIGFFTAKLALSVWHSPAKKMDQELIYSVESGDHFKRVANDLHQRDVLPSSSLIRVLQFAFEPDFILKAGEYRLPENASPAQIIDILNQGISMQRSITFIEGENFYQLLQRVNKHLKLMQPVSDDFDPDFFTGKDLVLSPFAQKLMPEGFNYEGWFLPDTYFYDKQNFSLLVLERAHRAMIDVLQSEWSSRQSDLPYSSAYEALIMASLIEKETGVGSERAQIAGVFVRRLNKRMRLQTDPTVIYGLGSDFDGDLRRADLRRDSPHNTYTRHGLPPTPITMPGRAAIHAALNPAPGDTLYFVAKGDGSHYFSSTLKEHQRAVRRYQLQHRRADYRSSGTPKNGRQLNKRAQDDSG